MKNPDDFERAIIHDCLNCGKTSVSENSPGQIPLCEKCLKWYNDSLEERAHVAQFDVAWREKNE